MSAELINAIDCAIANARAHDDLYPMHLPVDLRVSLKCHDILE